MVLFRRVFHVKITGVPRPVKSLSKSNNTAALAPVYRPVSERPTQLPPSVYSCVRIARLIINELTIDCSTEPNRFRKRPRQASGCNISNYIHSTKRSRVRTTLVYKTCTLYVRRRVTRCSMRNFCSIPTETARTITLIREHGKNERKYEKKKIGFARFSQHLAHSAGTIRAQLCSPYFMNVHNTGTF